MLGLMMAAEQVEGLFGDGVLVLGARIDPEAVAALTEAEAVLVERAVDKRRREFATARRLARLGLSRMGRAHAEILHAPDRSPLWPQGMTGSISHCDTRAVVALAAQGEAGTVGIDVEHRDGLRRDLWKSVFLPAETARLEAQFDEAERARMALVLFSAKEALYKAQHPWSRKYMGFHDLEVVLGAPDAGTFSCTFQVEVGPFGRGAEGVGRYRLDAFDGAEVVTAIQLSPTAANASSRGG
jgi:4'-phosphopantetheinyl transferase EntD